MSFLKTELLLIAPPVQLVLTTCAWVWIHPLSGGQPLRNCFSVPSCSMWGHSPSSFWDLLLESANCLFSPPPPPAMSVLLLFLESLFWLWNSGLTGSSRHPTPTDAQYFKGVIPLTSGHPPPPRSLFPTLLSFFPSSGNKSASISIIAPCMPNLMFSDCFQNFRCTVSSYGLTMQYLHVAFFVFILLEAHRAAWL